MTPYRSDRECEYEPHAIKKYVDAHPDYVSRGCLQRLLGSADAAPNFDAPSSIGDDPEEGSRSPSGGSTAVRNPTITDLMHALSKRLSYQQKDRVGLMILHLYEADNKSRTYRKYAIGSIGTGGPPLSTQETTAMIQSALAMGKHVDRLKDTSIQNGRYSSAPMPWIVDDSVIGRNLTLRQMIYEVDHNVVNPAYDDNASAPAFYIRARTEEEYEQLMSLMQEAIEVRSRHAEPSGERNTTRSWIWPDHQDEYTIGGTEIKITDAADMN